MSRRLSDETRKRMSDSHKGKTHSEETRNKISNGVNKGKNRKLLRDRIFDISYWEQFSIKSYHNMNRYLNFIKSRIELGDRKLEYSEKHHIVPKSFDESIIRSKNNIVNLTPREHFIAHKILSRCFNNEYNKKMVYAYHSMSYENSYCKHQLNSREYEDCKKQFSIMMSKKMSQPRSEEFKRKLSEAMSGENNPFYGKKHSEESRKKMSESSKGQIPWNTGKQLSEETKNKISKSNIGKKMPNRSKNSASPGTIWITNEITSKRIYPDELDKYLSEGWRKGKRYTERRKKVLENRNK